MTFPDCGKQLVNGRGFGPPAGLQAPTLQRGNAVIRGRDAVVNQIRYRPIRPSTGSPGRDVMPTYKAPVDDVMFLLSDVFHIDRYNNLPGFADATPDLVEAALAEAGKFAAEVLTPLNRVGDKEGCRRHDDGSVTTPTGFKDAYKKLTDGGWIGLSAPTEFGGQGLPVVLAQAINEFLCSANMAFGMYPGLTQGAIAALLAHATPEQKKLYLPKLISGQRAGTMNLTEPQAGTGLGLVRTRAGPQPDGS
jgi:alkylation response protein AidB-like acyl-CoA dehydrogenase